MKHVNSGRELETELLKAEEMLKADMASILQKVSMDTFRELILRSAADTGYLRSNWGVAVDKNGPNRIKNSGDPEGHYRDASYPNPTITFDSTINLYNNTEYAIYLEQGTPYMRAQPMVAPAAQYADGAIKILSQNISKKYYNI